MATRGIWLTVLLLAGCGTPPAPAAEGPDPLAGWIAAEARRLSAAAAEMGGGPELAADLSSIAADAGAGRALHAASRLPAARLRIEARAYGASRRGAVTDLEGLETEASAAGAELDRFENALAGALPARPAAVRALADAGWVRARAYHQAAVAYARVTSLEAGLFYLGAGRSLLATAAELAALPIDRPAGAGAATPSAATLEAELAELDRRSIAAYRAPGAEVDRHAEFIALNAEVKEARDLLAAGRPDGALFATLEARRQLEEILDDGRGPEAAELAERADAFRRRAASATWDASLGRLLVEGADAALAAETPGAPALRRARAILLHVLPRYFELHEETR